MRLLAVVGDQPSCHVDRLRPRGDACVSRLETPFGATRGDAFLQDAFMLGEVLQRARTTAPLQIRRRGAEDAPIRPQRARGQARVLRAADADGAVEAVLDQVHQRVGQRELHGDLGMAAHELGRQRSDAAPAHGHGRGHAYESAHLLPPLGELGFGVVDVGEDGLAALVIERPLVGEREPPRAALQQPHTEPRLQPRQPFAAHGRREAELASRGGEAAGGNGAHEQAHVVEFIHVEAP